RAGPRLGERPPYDAHSSARYCCEPAPSVRERLLENCSGETPKPHLRPSHVLSQLLQKLADAIDALVDLLHAGGEAETNVGFEAAVVAGDDRDVVLLQQRRAERNGVGDLDVAGLLADVRGDVGEAVERPLRAHARDFRQVAQSLPHMPAAL